MSAIGIHAHGTKKLGLRPASRKPALMLGKYLTGRTPLHPNAADHIAKAGLTFGLYQNDRFGDCGPVSVANSRRLTTAWLNGVEKDPTQEDVFDLYRRSGNPNFDPATDADDNGVDMQTMLNAVNSNGGIAGVKCIAFAALKTGDHNELRAAISIFGSVLFGVTLETAQQDASQHTIWSYSSSPIWGGHAILGAEYKVSPSERFGIVSWAQRIEMTSPFVRHQCDQAWAVIWPEHLGTASFQQGVDLNALKKDYQAITGRALP